MSVGEVGSTNFDRLSFLELTKVNKSFLQLININKILLNTFDAVKNTFAKLSTQLSRGMVDPVKDLHERVTNTWERFGDAAKGIFNEKTIKELGKTGKNLGKKTTLKSLKAAGGMFKQLASASLIGFVMQQFGEVIEALLMPLQLINPLIKTVAGLIKMMWAPIMVRFAPLIKHIAGSMLMAMPIFEGIGTIIADIVEFGLALQVGAWVLLVRIWEKFASGIEELGIIFQPVVGILYGNSPGLIPGFKALFNIMSTVVGFIYNSFNNTIGAIFGENGLIAQGWNFLTGLWDNTIGLLFGKNGFIAKAFRTTLDVVKAIVNTVFINPANAVIDLINKIPGVNLQGIPRLASGGYVPATPGGQLIIAGEGGQGEHVIPDNKFNEMINEQQLTNYYLSIREKKMEWSL